MFWKIKSSKKIQLNDKIELYNLEFKNILKQNKKKFTPSNRIIKENENLIIDDKSFVNVDLSLIKDFKYSSNEKNNLSNDFSIIKESIETSNNKFELVHMVIKNYIIDKKLYLEFPEEIDQKNFFLQLRFICLDTKVLFSFKKILSKYQISLEKIFNFDYVNTGSNMIIMINWAFLVNTLLQEEFIQICIEENFGPCDNLLDLEHLKKLIKDLKSY